MSFIQNIRNFFGNYLLSQQIKSLRRNKQFMNMEEAKTVGILFDATNSDDFSLIKKYILYLREMKKRVKALGFFNQKVIPQMAYSKLEYDFFSLKDLSWNNIPQNVYVKNFTEEEFDILIDLNIHDSFPLKYISAMSKARFKVGKKSNCNTPDLMIEADSSKGMKYFLRNMDTYLFLINKKQQDKQTQSYE